MMPTGDMKKFVAFLKRRGIKCTLKSSLFVPVCDCPAKDSQGFPDLIFNIEGYKYVYPAKTYVNKTWVLLDFGYQC